MTPEASAIVAALRDHGPTLTEGDVCRLAGLDTHDISRHVGALPPCVARDERGRFTLIEVPGDGTVRDALTLQQRRVIDALDALSEAHREAVITRYLQHEVT